MGRYVESEIGDDYELICDEEKMMAAAALIDNVRDYLAGMFGEADIAWAIEELQR